MSERARIITEATLVPISLLAGIVGVALYVASIASKGEANDKAIVELKENQSAYLKNLSQVRESLARIEGELSRRNGR